MTELIRASHIANILKFDLVSSMCYRHESVKCGKANNRTDSDECLCKKYCLPLTVYCWRWTKGSKSEYKGMNMLFEFQCVCSIIKTCVLCFKWRVNWWVDSRTQSLCLMLQLVSCSTCTTLRMEAESFHHKPSQFPINNSVLLCKILRLTKSL